MGGGFGERFWWAIWWAAVLVSDGFDGRFWGSGLMGGGFGERF